MNATLVEPIDFAEISAGTPGEGTPIVSRDLAILDHVSVTLDVVVGRATTTVKELFELTKGDTLALDTDLDAPVSLRVDGRTVARGHLVAVEDKFGLRITEIA